MQFERMYLITWIQRTTIHLEEIYEFLRGKFEALPLEPQKLASLREALKAEKVTLTEQNDFEILRAHVGAFEFTALEDGVFTLSTKVGGLTETRTALESYYREKLGPALAYLFSRGAPLPKELSHVEEIYPIILVVKDASDGEMERVRKELEEVWDTRVASKTTEILFGKTVKIVRLLKRDERRDVVLDELLANIVFLREFYKQLRQYLNLHRTMWDSVSAIRESGDFRYRDFPAVRRTIMDFLKTLFFVKARLAQMGDIARARLALLTPPVQEELKELGMFRFESAMADQRYLVDLWGMTIEYTQGTLHLLESLFQENTQRELGALKFITFIGVLAGFFGMNIAFPWDKQWSQTFPGSLTVVALMGLASLLFYFLLRSIIYNRRFIIKK